MSAWRLVVAPMAALAFCIVAVLLAAARPAPRPPPPRPLARAVLGAFLGYVARLALAGYVALLVIVAVFGVLVVGDRRALVEAATGGAFLVAVAVPAFVLFSWAEGRLRGGG